MGATPTRDADRPAQMPQASDEALMARTQEGCDASFEALVHRHYARVANFASRLTGRPDLGPDVAQHAFVVVYGQRARFRTGRRFLPWLYTIVRRHCGKVVRRESRTLAEDAPEGRTAPDPQAIAEGRELAAALRGALGQLPDRERAAVVMFHYMQWSYGEIAEALGCSPGAARTASCRGRRRLRALLADFGEELT